MLLTAPPDLAFVIGLPAGLMVVVGALCLVVYTLIGRISRG